LRSSLVVLLLMCTRAFAQEAPPEPFAAPPGAPADMVRLRCSMLGTNQRSCVECRPEAGGAFCERCARSLDGTLVADGQCSAPDPLDVDAINSTGLVMVARTKPRWDPHAKPAEPVREHAIRVTVSPASGGIYMYECYDDGKGGKACGRCDKAGCAGELDADDVARIQTQQITPSNPTRATAERKRSHCINAGPKLEECTECFSSNGGTACERCTRNAAGVAEYPCRAKLWREELAALTADGIVPNNQPAIAPEDAVPHTSRERPRSRFAFIGLEVGSMTPGDDKNIFGSGLGRGYAIGYSRFEFRFEQYDQDDRTHTYDNVAHAHAKLGIFSAGARIELFSLPLFRASVLVGAAVISRPQMQSNPDEILSDSVYLMDQYGIAAMLGGGVRLLDYISVDIRAYPASWGGINGTRAEVGSDGKLVMMPITDSPGGMPITITAGIAVDL
jgi:hypothetical protein